VSEDRPLASLAFSADGARLASAGDRRFLVWQVPSLRTLAERIVAGPTHAVAFSPDGATLATSWSLGRPQLLPSGEPSPTVRPHLELWRWGDGPNAVRELRGHENVVAAVVFTPDGKRLASVSWDRTVRQWDALSGRELARSSAFPNILRGIAVTPDGGALIVAGWSGQDPHAPSLTRVEVR
jgi:WD40 repeat protein